MNRSQKYSIHSDGGSRGNPGPSAAAYIIRGSDGRILAKGGEYIGISTNNHAEYTAVLLAIKELHSLAEGQISAIFHIDSQLVVSQLNGVYKVRNRNLWPIHQEITGIAENMDTVTFTHVPRELNNEADQMVNTILDEHA